MYNIICSALIYWVYRLLSILHKCIDRTRALASAGGFGSIRGLAGARGAGCICCCFCSCDLRRLALFTLQIGHTTKCLKQ